MSSPTDLVGKSGFVPQWTFTDRLRKAREHAGWTQLELAQRIGVSQRSVAGYETGRTRPGRPVLMMWAVVTGVDVDWLSAGSEPDEPASAQVSAGIRKCRFTSYGLVDNTRSAYHGDPFGGLVRAAA